jgi:glycine/D-amino acid oxidase-like deaminating enzyme
VSESSHHSADVIVIGGGVAGLSTALQLAARGVKVLLLEKADLASGATSQASGLLGQLRSTAEATRMLMDSLATLQQLEEAAGAAVFTQSGSVRVAQTRERAEEIGAAMAVAEAAGLALEPVDNHELHRLLPYMRVDDVLAAVYCPTDGYLNPPELARLYIQMARQNGVDLREQTPVEEITTQGGRVTGCRAGGQRFYAPVVINAGGPWSHLVAGMARQQLPTAAIGHCYLIAGPDPSRPVDPRSPSVRDRENRIYSRPTREGALHVGIYEAEPVLYRMEALPARFRMANLQTGRDHPTVRALMEAARRRFPSIDQAAPMRITTGIMSWTPDGSPLCGPLPDVEGLFHCAGFCGHGVMQSAAIGLLMADLLLDGRCRYDMAEIEADRYYDLPEWKDRARVEAGCLEAYASCYGRPAPRAGEALPDG